MDNTGIILTLAYPETIVRVSDEWFSPYLSFFGIGKKKYVKAGHAAIVLINKDTGILEYFDFGRYIIPSPYGRVRSKITDHELDFPLTAKIVAGKIKNLNDILKFLATNPKLTHGEGKMVASVCDEIDYRKAKDYILSLQESYFVRYGVFNKKASNCSRFVTTTLIASVNNNSIKKRLIRSTLFTPSTVGNVVIANTGNRIHEVSAQGEITGFTSTIKRENIKYFRDRLKDFTPNSIGKLEAKLVDGIHGNAQWLGGVGAGAWFELHPTNHRFEYVFRRISPYGNIDVHDVFVINETSFKYHEDFNFLHHSNCHFFHIEQHGKIYRFNRKVTD
tara:strand:- start:4617 stop:5615 length:999 start_codon:yes stop_codon:yes gene_type:complete